MPVAVTSIIPALILGACLATFLLLTLLINYRAGLIAIGCMFFFASISPIIDAWEKRVYQTWFLPIQAYRAELFGMVADAARATVIADFLEAWPDRPPVVLDPVMIAKGGAPLLHPDAVAVLRERLHRAIEHARVRTALGASEGDQA